MGEDHQQLSHWGVPLALLFILVIIILYQPAGYQPAAEEKSILERPVAQQATSSEDSAP